MIIDAEMDANLTERLVDQLCELEETPMGATGASLARELRMSRYQVLRELHQLEAMGLVVRTGSTRGTRWWLA